MPLPLSSFHRLAQQHTMKPKPHCCTYSFKQREFLQLHCFFPDAAPERGGPDAPPFLRAPQRSKVFPILIECLAVHLLNPEASTLLAIGMNGMCPAVCLAMRVPCHAVCCTCTPRQTLKNPPCWRRRQQAWLRAKELVGGTKRPESPCAWPRCCSYCMRWKHGSQLWRESCSLA